MKDKSFTRKFVPAHADKSAESLQAMEGHGIYMKNLKAVIIIVICAVLCIGYYFYLSNRSGKTDGEMSEIEKIISKDLDKSYPSTPREVIKFYNRILKCFYNEEYTEKELEKLGEQARKLMDEELLANNPEPQYYAMLQSDIEEVLEDEATIIRVSISTSNEIVYKKVDGRECAYVESSYFLKGKKSSEKAGQTYILRKDEDEKWKVLGYYRPEGEDTAEND